MHLFGMARDVVRPVTFRAVAHGPLLERQHFVELRRGDPLSTEEDLSQADFLSLPLEALLLAEGLLQLIAVDEALGQRDLPEALVGSGLRRPRRRQEVPEAIQDFVLAVHRPTNSRYSCSASASVEA